MSRPVDLARRLGAPLHLLTVAATLATVAPSSAQAQEFSFLPPGDLAPNSGDGREDETVYVPGMRFPVESAPAFPNSQVWGHGGSQGPGGGQCDVENFSYPWRDNYCEERSWDMPLCPSGVGHQGQDIRGATCDKNVHWIVSASDGTVTNIGSYSVYITAPDGTRFDYLHGGNVQVSDGQAVTRGQRIAMISNEFGGTPTTVHLHFNIRQNVSGVGSVFVPPYMSLVESYYELIGPPPSPVSGALDDVSCEGIRGWTADPGALDDAAEARLYFDGGPEAAAGHPVLADDPRDDLCSALGSCDHGFATGLPLSLLDGAAHDVRAFGTRGLTGEQAELEGSPKSFTCTLTLPEGVRRSIAGPEAEAAWRFSSFWDVAEVSAGVIEAIDEGADLPGAPRVVASDAAPDELWLVDGGIRRRVGDAAEAWDIDAAFAERIPAAELDELPEGIELPARPFVLRGPDGAAFLIDAFPSGPQNGAGGGGAGGADGPSVGAGLVVVGSGAGGAGDAAEGGEDGCGCEVVGRPARGGAAALVVLGLVAAGVRRRRR